MDTKQNSSKKEDEEEEETRLEKSLMTRQERSIRISPFAVHCQQGELRIQRLSKIQLRQNIGATRRRSDQERFLCPSSSKGADILQSSTAADVHKRACYHSSSIWESK